MTETKPPLGMYSEESEIHPVFSGRLSCWADTCRYYESTGQDKIMVMLSMFGAQNAVEAAWARLAGLQKKKSGYYSGVAGKVQVNKDLIRIDPESRPVSVKTAIAEGKVHLVCIDRALTVYHGAKSSFFYFADQPSNFRSRLGQFLEIPTHEDWNQWLWETGLEQGLIHLLDGFGHEVYHVTSTTDEWLPLIQDGLKHGDIA